MIVSVSPLSFEENSTVSAVTVSATDNGTDDDITGYGIVHGGDGSQFSLTECRCVDV